MEHEFRIDEDALTTFPLNYQAYELLTLDVPC